MIPIGITMDGEAVKTDLPHMDIQIRLVLIFEGKRLLLQYR